MAFVSYTRSPNIPAMTYTAVASTAYTKGFLCYRDTTTGEIKEATSSVGDATNIEGIGLATFTSASSSPTIDLYPISPGQMFIVDCTNNTAANQLNKAHLLTDGGTVNNTSTHSTDKKAIFVAIALVGAAADKKLLGYVAKVGQVTA